MTWLVDADVTEPLIATGVVASGGTESVVNIGGQLYRVHKFTSNGTFAVSNGGTVEAFLVGGGGAGGSVGVTSLIGAININFRGFAGGGGAGAVISSDIALSSGSFSVVVGAETTTSGNDSYIQNGGTDVIRAKGGGRGGRLGILYASSSPSVSRIAGEDGGSGGGGMAHTNGFNFAGLVSARGAGVIAQGNNGGQAATLARTAAGGGGGSAAVGSQGLPDAGGNGGNGSPFFIDGTLAIYGAGGGGAGYTTNGIGGVGGGGAGANMGGSFAKVNGSDAQANTGSGGGGGAYGATVHVGTDGAVGGKGASGIVIIRYPIEG